MSLSNFFDDSMNGRAGTAPNMNSSPLPASVSLSTSNLKNSNGVRPSTRSVLTRDQNLPELNRLLKGTKARPGVQSKNDDMSFSSNGTFSNGSTRNVLISPYAKAVSSGPMNSRNRLSSRGGVAGNLHGGIDNYNNSNDNVPMSSSSSTRPKPKPFSSFAPSTSPYFSDSRSMKLSSNPPTTTESLHRLNLSNVAAIYGSKPKPKTLKKNKSKVMRTPSPGLMTSPPSEGYRSSDMVSGSNDTNDISGFEDHLVQHRVNGDTDSNHFERPVKNCSTATDSDVLKSSPRMGSPNAMYDNLHLRSSKNNHSGVKNSDDINNQQYNHNSNTSSINNNNNKSSDKTTTTNDKSNRDFITNMYTSRSNAEDTNDSYATETDTSNTDMDQPDFFSQSQTQSPLRVSTANAANGSQSVRKSSLFRNNLPLGMAATANNTSTNDLSVLSSARDGDEYKDNENSQRSYSSTSPSPQSTGRVFASSGKSSKSNLIINVDPNLETTNMDRPPSRKIYLTNNTENHLSPANSNGNSDHNGNNNHQGNVTATTTVGDSSDQRPPTRQNTAFPFHLTQHFDQLSLHASPIPSTTQQQQQQSKLFLNQTSNYFAHQYDKSVSGTISEENDNDINPNSKSKSNNNTMKPSLKNLNVEIVYTTLEDKKTGKSNGGSVLTPRVKSAVPGPPGTPSSCSPRYQSNTNQLPVGVSTSDDCNQRPPSRQKINAQNLDDNKPNIIISKSPSNDNNTTTTAASVGNNNYGHVGTPKFKRSTLSLTRGDSEKDLKIMTGTSGSSKGYSKNTSLNTPTRNSANNKFNSNKSSMPDILTSNTAPAVSNATLHFFENSNNSSSSNLLNNDSSASDPPSSSTTTADPRRAVSSGGVPLSDNLSSFSFSPENSEYHTNSNSSSYQQQYSQDKEREDNRISNTGSPVIEEFTFLRKKLETKREREKSPFKIIMNSWYDHEHEQINSNNSNNIGGRLLVAPKQQSQTQTQSQIQSQHMIDSGRGLQRPMTSHKLMSGGGGSSGSSMDGSRGGSSTSSGMSGGTFRRLSNSNHDQIIDEGIDSMSISNHGFSASNENSPERYLLQDQHQLHSSHNNLWTDSHSASTNARANAQHPFPLQNHNNIRDIERERGKAVGGNAHVLNRHNSGTFSVASHATAAAGLEASMDEFDIASSYEDDNNNMETSVDLDAASKLLETSLDATFLSLFSL